MVLNRVMIHVSDDSTVDSTASIKRFDSAYYLYSFGATALRWIPRPLARIMMNVTGFVASYISGASRTTIEANLRRVLGGGVEENVLQRIVRRSFMSYARYWSDVAHLPSTARRNLSNLLCQDELTVFEEHLPQGPAILALPHLGAWEIGGLWAKQRGIHMHSVAEPAASERLTSWFTYQREQLGLEVLPLGKETVPQLLKALRRNELVALLADRDVVGDGVEVMFFGERTKMPGGPAMLALRSGAPLLPCAVYCDRRDRHRPLLLDAIPTDRRAGLREDIVRVTQDLATAFEHLILKAPEQWHVFQPQWTLDMHDGR